MDIPIWLVTLVVILLFVLALRGSLNFKFGKWSLSTSNKKVCSIPTNHIYQFRNLKSAIKFDVTRTSEKFESLYRNQFLKAQVDLDVSKEVQHAESLEYKLLLIESLDTIFMPKVKTIIYANHFPKIMDGESLEDFKMRFKKTFTKKKFTYLLQTTGDWIRDNWEIPSIDRLVYEKGYLGDAELLDAVLDELNDLFLTCQRRKTRIFNDMASNESNVTITILEDEWDLIYG